MAVLDGDAFTPSARKFPDEVGNVRVEKPFDGQSPRIGDGSRAPIRIHRCRVMYGRFTPVPERAPDVRRNQP